MALAVSFGSLIASLVASSIFYVVYKTYCVRRRFRNLPGPPHSWIWGHLKVLGEVGAKLPPRCHPQILYTELARQYNLEGVFYLDIWPVGLCQVVLNDPELQDQVHLKMPLDVHYSASDFLGPVVGRNVIALVNGPVWKSLHNAMVPAFSWSHIRSLTGVMVDECSHYRAALNGFATSGKAFSMENTTMKLIFDIIGQVVFNYPLHAQTEGSQHLNDLREMTELSEHQLDVMRRFNPRLRLYEFFQKRKVLGRLHPQIAEKIKERYDLLLRNKVVPSRKNPSSILDLMLRDKIQDEEGNVRKLDSTDLTAREMAILTDNIKGLLLGGLSTTNDTLCATFMLLSNAPEVIAKVRDEHDRAFGKSHDQTIQTLLDAPEKLQDLPYTEAVFKEALRLFPVGFGVRCASEGDTIRYKDHDYAIDQDLVIIAQNHDLHYNPKFFPNPSKFSPERWLDPLNEIPTSYWRPFSRGPRGCLGRNLAMNILKVVLIMTARDYDFACVGVKPNAKPKVSWTDLDTVWGDMILQEIGVSAKLRGGMMMTVKRRSRT